MENEEWRFEVMEAGLYRLVLLLYLRLRLQ